MLKEDVSILLKAKELGFVRDTLEKVYRLLEVLEFIGQHPFLSKILVLKGGTAINMLVFDFPRLSVDIDFDLTQNLDYDEMMNVRWQINAILHDYMIKNGYSLHTRSKETPILDSKVYRYTNSSGNIDNIKIEINYSLRCHVYESKQQEIYLERLDYHLSVMMLEPVELFAAKINALLSRAAVRDLYDVCNMIENKVFEEDQLEVLKKTVIFYLAISAKEIDMTFGLSKIDKITINKVKRDLFPVLAKKEHFDLEARKKIVKSFIRHLLQLNENEKEFLEQFTKGYYHPELLFDDPMIIERIKDHPMAIWKTRDKIEIA